MNKLVDHSVGVVWLKPMRVLSSFIKESYTFENLMSKLHSKNK